MKINAGEIRVGMLLEYKNDLWQVLKTQHVYSKFDFGFKFSC